MAEVRQVLGMVWPVWEQVVVPWYPKQHPFVYGTKEREGPEGLQVDC